MTTKSKKNNKEAVLSVKGLQVHYETSKGWVKAVEDVTFDLERGKRLALVGESGSGKTTMAMGLMRMIKEPGKIVSGSIEINGKDIIPFEIKEPQRISIYSNRLFNIIIK